MALRGVHHENEERVAVCMPGYRIRCMDKMCLFSCFTLLYVLYFSLVGEFYHFISSVTANKYIQQIIIIIINRFAYVSILFWQFKTHVKWQLWKKRKPGDGLSICYNDVRLIHLKKIFSHCDTPRRKDVFHLLPSTENFSLLSFTNGQICKKERILPNCQKQEIIHSEGGLLTIKQY